MVVKVMSSTPSVVIPINYNEKKVAAGVAEVVAAINIPDDSYETMYHTMADREDINIRTEKPSLHISFNPAPEDVFDDEKMVEYIKEWMSRQGLGEQPFAIYKHEDISRGHYHVVSTKLKKDGRSVKCHNLGYRNKHIMLDLQEEYGYIIGPSKSAECEMERFHFDPAKGMIWKQMDYIVDSVITTFNYRSDAEYRTVLEACGLRCDIKPSKYGNNEKTMVLHYSKPDGRITGRPKFYDHDDYELMNQQFTKAKPKTGTVVQDIRKAISEAQSIQDFQALMKNAHYYVRPFYNARGNYQGLSIVDFNENDVVKASELGQETASLLKTIYTGDIAAAQALVKTKMPEKKTIIKEGERDAAIEREQKASEYAKRRELWKIYYESLIPQYHDVERVSKDAFALYANYSQQLKLSYEEISQNRSRYNKLVTEYVECDRKVKRAENSSELLMLMAAMSMAVSPLLGFVLSMLVGIIKASEAQDLSYRNKLGAKAMEICNDIEIIRNEQVIQRALKRDALNQYLDTKGHKLELTNEMNQLKSAISEIGKGKQIKDPVKSAKPKQKAHGPSIG